ncbi:hypothetical protein, partial [Herbaspirillum chlorophenolicum]|uniref:hypothetical protein n=1 Tax=Herbaspirillum chlorophenolicum TaxID=211589 RepID=UPI001E301F18
VKEKAQGCLALPAGLPPIPLAKNLFPISLGAVQMPFQAVCGVVKPRRANRPGCVLRLASHPEMTFDRLPARSGTGSKI